MIITFVNTLKIVCISASQSFFGTRVERAITCLDPFFIIELRVRINFIFIHPLMWTLDRPQKWLQLSKGNHILLPEDGGHEKDDDAIAAV